MASNEVRLNLIDPFMFSDPEDLDRPDARQRVEMLMIRRGKETIFEKNAFGQLVKKFKERHPHPIEIEFTSRERERKPSYLSSNT